MAFKRGGAEARGAFVTGRGAIARGWTPRVCVRLLDYTGFPRRTQRRAPTSCVCVCVCVEAGNHLNDNLRSGTYIRVPGAELICLFLGRILTRRRGGPPILVASLFLHLYFEDFSIPLSL